nr:AAA family ATPase [Herbiconiux sp.]
MGPEERFVEQVRRRWQAYRSESLSRVRDIQQVGLAQILAILFGSAIPIFSRPVGVGAEDAYRLVQNFLREQRISFPVRREDFVSRYEESVEHQQVVAKIVEVQKQADEVLRPQREFQAVIDEFYSGDKHLILNRTPSPRDALSIEIGDRAIPLKALSSGEKQLLQLLLEVLAAEDTTVMIDEPELSMHVDWQQRLVQSMRRINPNCQLILATHSPEVMVDVDDAVIFEL